MSSIPRKKMESELKLPAVMTEPCLNFYDYVSLFYGRAGIGKTTLLTTAPDCLLLATERVSKGISAFVFNSEDGGCKTWQIFLQAIKLLQKDGGRFRTVAIDTVTTLYDLCLEYIIKTRGCHPSDEAYGKGWNALKTEWELGMRSLLALGKGVIMTAHEKEREITSYSGEKFNRIGPNVSGSCMDWLKAKTDFVFYCEYVKVPSQKEPLRVMFTTGDEVVDAKHADVFGDFPPYIPMQKDRGINLINDIFSGKARGLDYNHVHAAKETGKAALEHIKSHQRVDVVAGADGKKRLAGPVKKKI